MTKMLGNFFSMVEAGPKGAVFRPFRWVVIPLLILLVFTLLARANNFDFAIQKAIYTAGGDSWVFGDRSLWAFLYNFGTIPAAVICGLALIGFILGLFKDSFKRWRQCFLFIILLGAIGPGVVTNLILKEYWGRPRPREVTELGGKYAFEPVLTIDKTSKGKSFPCGHATMGYFFIGGFFLFRRYRRDLAWTFLIFGLCLGFFMGVARMCKGGHFFSDVIWSGAIVYFVAMILYFDLKLFRGLTRNVAENPTPKWMKIVVPVVGAAFLGGILLATPYRDVRDHKMTPSDDRLYAILVLKRGTIDIVPSDTFHVRGEAWGHGVPTSKVADHFVENKRENDTVVYYGERMSGRFTEVDQNLTVKIPWDQVYHLRIEASDCEVNLVLPENFDQTKTIQLIDGNADVTVKNLPTDFAWKDSNDQEKFGKPADRLLEGNPVIDVFPPFSGKLLLDR